MYVCVHAPDAGAIGQSFSPQVEMQGDHIALFTITGRQTPEQVQARAPHAQIGVAATAEAAILAARHFPGLTVIEPGEEARMLGSLPLDCLPPDPEIFETLDLWGIHSLGDLARLPEDGLAGRLGQRGLQLQKLARGTLVRPLQASIPAVIYEESIELEHPIELQEPLLFLIGRFLYDLAKRLTSQSLAAQSIHLTLNHEERVLRLPFPTRDVKFLIKLVEHSLDVHPPLEPIARVRLNITPTDPRRVQHGLFTPATPEPEKLELTLGKIRGLVGADNVGYPSLQNTHRPGAGLGDAPPLAFRYFRPPLEARVEVEAGMPRRLHAASVRGKILRVSGPWRTSGDWWRGDSWNRDEWDLALDDGVLYRLYHECKKWFLEGSYD